MYRRLYYLIPAFFLLGCSGTPDKLELYHQMTKVDAHVHIRTGDPAIMEYAASENFKLLTINTRSDSQLYIDEQKHAAIKMNGLYPESISWLATFSMENFEEPHWTERTVQELQENVDSGAVGYKIWKDVGMTFRDSLGNFIFLDDPLFEPILEFMEGSGLTLLTHIGEPKNCWLPIESMTVNGDKSYFAENPQYHMYLHPDYPSHERLMESRDNVLARYPDLLMVGAHMGSLEWDVDVLAERLDRYPNFAVDLAARVCHLQVQDRQKVIDFILRYQDRILYATDMSVSGDNFKGKKDWIETEWRTDWAYFATDSLMQSRNVEGEFRGLNLDKEVLEKIYANNARHWYPGVFQ